MKKYLLWPINIMHQIIEFFQILNIIEFQVMEK